MRCLCSALGHEKAAIKKALVHASLPFPLPPPLTPPPPSRLLLFAFATLDGGAALVPLLDPHPTSSLPSLVHEVRNNAHGFLLLGHPTFSTIGTVLRWEVIIEGSGFSGGVHTLFWFWETGGPNDEAFVGRTTILFCLRFDFIVLHDGV